MYRRNFLIASRRTWVWQLCPLHVYDADPGTIKQPSEFCITCPPIVAPKPQVSDDWRRMSADQDIVEFCPRVPNLTWSFMCCNSRFSVSKRSRHSDLTTGHIHVQPSARPSFRAQWALSIPDASIQMKSCDGGDNLNDNFDRTMWQCAHVHSSWLPFGTLTVSCSNS